MKLILELLRELSWRLPTRYRWLLACLPLALALGGYGLYWLTVWLAAQPGAWLLMLSIWVALWLLRRDLLRHEITVEQDTAVVVKQAGGGYKTLYRGRHKLGFGERVTARFSLRPKTQQTNLEEVYTREGEPVRLSATCDLYIADPLRFFLEKRRPPDDFAEINRWALQVVIQEFSFEELYNSPAEANVLVAQTINSRLNDCGLRVSNYCLDEVVWPGINQLWRKYRAQLPLQAGPYWSATGSLKPCPMAECQYPDR